MNFSGQFPAVSILPGRGIRPEFQAAANLARLDQPGKTPVPIDTLIGHYDVVVAFGSPQEATNYGSGAKVMFRNSGATVFDIGAGSSKPSPAP